MNKEPLTENQKKKIFAKYIEHFDEFIGGVYLDKDICICEEEECTCKTDNLLEKPTDENLK